VSKYFQTGTIN